MTKINITISDQERSFSATVEPTLENIVQAVDAALQAMGWHYNTVRNTIYELYREKMEADGMFDEETDIEKLVYDRYLQNVQQHIDKSMFEELEQQIKQATPNWSGVDADSFMDEIRGRESEDEE